MSISFVNKELLEEDLSYRGVIVIDTNLQGAWETGILYQMKMAFPKIYKHYMSICLRGDRLYKPGDAVLLTEDGYKVVLLFTKDKRKVARSIVLSNLEIAIKNMLRLVGSDEFIYSPILGREDGQFVETLSTIKKLIKPELRNWFIYTRKSRSH